MICSQILKQQGVISDREWNLFLRGSIVRIQGQRSQVEQFLVIFFAYCDGYPWKRKHTQERPSHSDSTLDF